MSAYGHPMRRLSPALIAAAMLVQPAAALAQTGKRVRAAEAMLVRQMACNGGLAPARTVRTLLARKLVRDRGDTIDGSSRYEPATPLRLGPFPIVHLTGWEGTADLRGRKPFTRGPGTAPPTFLQITVRAERTMVGHYLHRSGSRAVVAEESPWPRPGTVTVQCVAAW